jgi:hypothetical protein
MSSRVNPVLRPRRNELFGLEATIAFFMAKVDPLAHEKKYISVAATTPIAQTNIQALARNGTSELRS